MRRYATITIIVAFAILTIVYFRQVIWSPPEALLTKHLATDLYGHFVHVWERLQLLSQGFVPIGDYWVQRGGGFPAASNDQMIIPQEFLLMIVYALTGSFALSLKILIPLFYFATAAAAYWYGLVLFKRKDASVVLAVSYTFSMYGVNQLEHLELIGVQPLILLALIFLEKLLTTLRHRYVLLTSAFLFLVFLSNLYATFFTLLFVGFRIAFHLLTQSQRLEALKSALKVGVLFTLAATPFLLPQIINMPTQGIKDVLTNNLLFYTQPPALYFLRNASFQPYLTEIYFMYLGVSVMILAIIPMLVKRSRPPLYVFYLLVTIFFMLYSVGQYGPVNLALWFNEHFPLAFFIRVPGRSLMIGCLGLSVCAAIGFTLIVGHLRRHATRLALCAAIVAVIFADLTIGFEPYTMTVPTTQDNVYRYLKAQSGDFRIIEVSSVHDQQAMTTIYTEQDTLNSILWGFGFFEPSRAFTKLYIDYTNLRASAAKAALYGVRYIVVNADPQYSETFRDALAAIQGPTLSQVHRVEKWLSQADDYRLVYNEGHTNIYENRLWRGMVSSNATHGLGWGRIDPNTLTITVISEQPTTVHVSQGYSRGWIVESNGVALEIRNEQSIQAIDVPAGTHSFKLRYQYYESWITVALAFLIALLLVALPWRLSPVALVIFSVTLLVYSVQWEANAIYQISLLVLGATLMIAATTRNLEGGDTDV